MPGLLPDVDPNGLVEYSVVYTDRSVNHMSLSFREVMTDISSTLKEVYNADAVAVVPGSGTFGMEAVARQFATNQNVMVIRNGWFSYRWTQILEMGSIASSHTVSMANPVRDEEQAPFAPPDLDLVLTKINEENLRLFSLHMWKPQQECFYPIVTLHKLLMLLTKAGGSWSLTALHQEPYGLI